MHVGVEECIRNSALLRHHHQYRLHVTVQVRENATRRSIFFAVSCHGSDYRLDRMARIMKFLDDHGSCRPEWRPYARQEGESEGQHLQRLKQHFSFEIQQSVGTVEPVQKEVTAKAGAEAFICFLLKPTEYE